MLFYTLMHLHTMLKSCYRRSGTKQVIQAMSVYSVPVLLRTLPTNYIVSLPKNYNPKNQKSCVSASLCVQRNECICEECLQKDRYCVPFINFDSILIANNYGQKLLVENTLIYYTHIHNVQIYDAVVMHENDLD